MDPMNSQPSHDRTIETDEGVDTVSIFQDPGLMQQVSRTEQDGFDTLVGYFRCQFECGQQRAVLHVVIQPAMPNLPEVETMVVDAENVRVRLTDIKVYGVRAEIVLSQPAASRMSILVEVIAAAPITVGSQ